MDARALFVIYVRFEGQDASVQNSTRMASSHWIYIRLVTEVAVDTASSENSPLLLSCPLIGNAPTPNSVILRAAISTVSAESPHRTSSVMISRAAAMSTAFLEYSSPTAIPRDRGLSGERQHPGNTASSPDSGRGQDE